MPLEFYTTYHLGYCKKKMHKKDVCMGSFISGDDQRVELGMKRFVLMVIVIMSLCWIRMWVIYLI